MRRNAIFLTLFLFAGMRNESESCFTGNTFLQSDDPYGVFPIVSSALNCQIACQNVGSCQFFSFRTASGNCNLFLTTKGSLSNADYVSGPKFCNKNQSCMALNTDYTSGPGVQIVAAVFNLISCQQLCMTFPNCLDFTVVVSNGDCYLKSGGDAVPSPRAGFKTGKRVCESINCLDYGMNYFGTDVISVPWSPSASECQFECQKNDKCRFFTYNTMTGGCILKSSKAPAPLSYGISGPKFCSPQQGLTNYLAVKPLAMLVKGMLATTTQLSNIACAAQCNLLYATVGSCSGFTFSAATGVCETFVFSSNAFARFYTNEPKNNVFYMRKDVLG